MRRATGPKLGQLFGALISIHALLAESDRHHKRATPATPISIHALLAESDASGAPTRPGRGNFYPRSPCGERLGQVSGSVHRTMISIHALLAESDAPGAVTSPAVIKFLSTLSLRRATETAPYRVWEIQISIHALLAESDLIRYRINAK